MRALTFNPDLPSRSCPTRCPRPHRRWSRLRHSRSTSARSLSERGHPARVRPGLGRSPECVLQAAATAQVLHRFPRGRLLARRGPRRSCAPWTPPSWPSFRGRRPGQASALPVAGSRRCRRFAGSARWRAAASWSPGRPAASAASPYSSPPVREPVSSPPSAAPPALRACVELGAAEIVIGPENLEAACTACWTTWAGAARAAFYRLEDDGVAMAIGRAAARARSSTSSSRARDRRGGGSRTST